MDELEGAPVATLLEPAGPDAPPVIALRGEIDSGTAASVREVVDKALSGNPDLVAFDLADLSFMDSSGISILVHALNTAGKVELRHPTDIVRRVIEVTGLAGAFSIVQ
jgi:anti-sigma B factor antagonist